MLNDDLAFDPTDGEHDQDVFGGITFEDEDIDLADDGTWIITDTDGVTGVITVEGDATIVRWSDGTISTRTAVGDIVSETIEAGPAGQ